MAKYHLKLDGTPAKCSADSRPCPRGGAESHYPSEAAARTAFEVSMGSSLAPSAKKQPSLLDRLRGKVTPAPPTSLEQLNVLITHFKNHYIFSDNSAIYKLAESSAHYDVLVPESLAVVQHAMAVAKKQRKLQEAVDKIVSENYRAFDYEAMKRKWSMLDNEDWSGKRIQAPILKPGGNEALHRSLTPLLNQLIEENSKLKKQRSELEKEAGVLHAQVMEEGALDPQQRQVLSAEAQRLYNEALADSPQIPTEEEVQDRQTWTQSRIEAVDELTNRGVL